MNFKLVLIPAINYLKTPQCGSKGFHRWVAPTLKELKRRKDKMGPEPPIHRSKFVEWNYKSELYAFGKRLGEDFDQKLLKQAFTDSSYIKFEEERQKDVGIEPELALESNDSLENSGMKFIDLYIEKYLDVTLPNLPKTYKNNIKEYLLSTENLAHVSSHIGIDDLILSSDFPVQNETLSKGLKSVVQALLLSSGETKAALFVRDLIAGRLAGLDISIYCTPENPIKELTISLQNDKRGPPEPRLISITGKNTILACYQIGIYSDKNMVGRGCGENIDIAVDMAACDALWRKWGVTPSKKPFPFNIEVPSVILNI